jgi:purine-binding chemotaxis protein CheW
VVIILNVAGRTVGMVVDSVSDVLELQAGPDQARARVQRRVDATTSPAWAR